MSIGDVHSDARGSGARFNDGKAPLHLIPLRLIADSLCEFAESDAQSDAACALSELGDFQTTGAVEPLDTAIWNLRHYWSECAAVFDYGRKKYAEWNWAKGMAWSIPLACAARHALAAMKDGDNDPESGLPHVGHMLCNLVMLRTFVDTYPEGDDLPPPRLFARLPPSPDYDPASVAFRHGDVPLTTAKEPAYAALDDLRRERPGRTAAEVADADGCMEYGNPITPAGAQPDVPPWRLP